MMNHRLNAKIHSYPFCPECEAPLGCPCRTSPTNDRPRSPHEVRTKIINGEIAIDYNPTMRTGWQVLAEEMVNSLTEMLNPPGHCGRVRHALVGEDLLESWRRRGRILIQQSNLATNTTAATPIAKKRK